MNKKMIIIVAIVTVLLINLPNIILNIQNKDIIPKEIKEELLLNGKQYFEITNEKEVSIIELINRGYIEKDVVINFNCNLPSSTIKKIKMGENNYKYILKMYCQNKKSELSLFE